MAYRLRMCLWSQVTTHAPDAPGTPDDQRSWTVHAEWYDEGSASSRAAELGRHLGPDVVLGAGRRVGAEDLPWFAITTVAAPDADAAGAWVSDLLRDATGFEVTRCTVEAQEDFGRRATAWLTGGMTFPAP
jgi:hypothetical protein